MLGACVRRVRRLFKRLRGVVGTKGSTPLLILWYVYGMCVSLRHWYSVLYALICTSRVYMYFRNYLLGATTSPAYLK